MAFDMSSAQEAFISLGSEIDGFLDESKENDTSFKLELEQRIPGLVHYNGWFTEENIKRALKGLSIWLNKEALENWTKPYQFSDKNKRVGIVMAGNIPLVGFHDFLSVVLSGNTAVIKMSSSDNQLLPLMINLLTEKDPELKERIQLVQKLQDFDAVIATGSNNSARYFEYYFKDVPHIIRKNRNSVAVLDGEESEEELKNLGQDIFTYFGLGCRNVSKVLIPEGFDIDRIFGAIQGHHEIGLNKKYANNYDYYKAFYLLNKENLLENGFVLFKEDESVHSPVSMLFYQYYKDTDELLDYLSKEKENIQCIVSRKVLGENSISFGQSQYPSLTDYADGVDTMKFLSEI